MITKFSFLFFTTALWVDSALAEPVQWNQFRGPNGSGVMNQCQPPLQIDVAHATWTVALPPGHSSPVLSDSQLFLTAIDGERLITMAFDKASGNLAWRKEAPKTLIEKVHQTNSPAASTPWVDAERVVVYFGSFGLLCYDHEGTLLWQKPIPTPRSLYGMSTSPIAFEDSIILVLDNENKLPDSELSQSKVIAVDVRTGDLRWEAPRPLLRSGWSTPMIWSHPGGKDLVVLGHRRLCAYNPSTGDVSVMTIQIPNHSGMPCCLSMRTTTASCSVVR